MKLTPYASLLTLNTLALDAHCRWLAEVERIDDLPQLVANPELADLPRLVLGGGSNVLFCDDFAGVVVLNRLKGITLHDEGITGCCTWRLARTGMSWCAIACSRAGSGSRTWR